MNGNDLPCAQELSAVFELTGTCGLIRFVVASYKFIGPRFLNRASAFLLAETAENQLKFEFSLVKNRSTTKICQRGKSLEKHRSQPAQAERSSR